MATLVPLPVPRPAKRARLNEDGQTRGDVVALSPQMQQTIVGQPYDIFSCSVVVRIDGELGEVEDSDIAKSLELVQGRYFKIGVFSNRPLYRQEVPSHENAVNTSELFLYFMDQGHASGWYISEDLECTPTAVHHSGASRLGRLPEGRLGCCNLAGDHDRPVLAPPQEQGHGLHAATLAWDDRR